MNGLYWESLSDFAESVIMLYSTRRKKDNESSLKVLLTLNFRLDFTRVASQRLTLRIMNFAYDL